MLFILLTLSTQNPMKIIEKYTNEIGNNLKHPHENL